MHNILAVEDSAEIAKLIEETFAFSDLRVTCADTISSAWDKITNGVFDLVILDIMLPDGNGLELFAKIKSTKQHKEVPVIFLTAKEEISSKLSAFSLGAEDYIVKPFNPLELKARVEMRLKKNQRAVADTYSIGPFEFHIGAQRLRLIETDQFLELTPREFKIFYFLAKNPDLIYDREKILAKLTGLSIHVTDRTIDTQVCTLRRKLGSLSKYVESISREGYRFNPNPSAGPKQVSKIATEKPLLNRKKKLPESKHVI